MEEFAIGEVARRVGIRASAIRYYESVEVLPAPQRINGRRRYDSRVFDRLAVIQMAQQAGFTVAELRTLFNGFTTETTASARWEVLARQKLVEVDALMSRVQAMKGILEEILLAAVASRPMSVLNAYVIKERAKRLHRRSFSRSE